jgi:hypothetical protein
MCIPIVKKVEDKVIDIIEEIIIDEIKDHLQPPPLVRHE